MRLPSTSNPSAHAHTYTHAPARAAPLPWDPAQGWDKTYCLRYLEGAAFKEVHFFGDKTFPGGNDYEIFSSPHVKGHTVTGPEDTEAQCRALFG